MYKALILASAIVFTILGGCSVHTTMQKLKSDSRFDDMNSVFWAKEHDSKSTLWNEAIAYCKKYSEKPNCGTVMQVYIVSNGSTDVPAYGSSGNSLTSPDFK